MALTAILRPEIFLKQPEQWNCEADCRITRQEMPSPRLAQRGEAGESGTCTIS